MTTLILSVFCSISASAYDVEVDGIYYNLNTIEKTAEVTDGNYHGVVTIPKSFLYNLEKYSVTSIGTDAFKNCSDLATVAIPNSVTCIGDRAFYGCKGLTSITIPNTVTYLGSEAFMYCEGLTSITIPNSITIIYNRVFYGCESLSSITIPNSVTSIGNSAFCGCSSLISITLPNSVSSIGDGAFWSCKGLTSITIPNTVTYLGSEAFRYCEGLTSLTIPNSVKNIGIKVFDGCKGLKTITIPNSITSIEEQAFANCKSLTSITIPNSVTLIGYGAFKNCSNLTSIIIPNSVTQIDGYAFSYCKKIKNVYCYSEDVPLAEYTIFAMSYIEFAILYVPASSIDKYKEKFPWNSFFAINPIEGTDVETKKCETPTISFVDGKLTFSCATEGVEYVSEVTCSDVNKYYSNEINLAACYDITVTAMKTGYDNSDVATAKLYWLTSSGSLEGAGINNVSMRGIAIQSAGGFINISGLDNNETVSFYGIDGKALGSATAINGTTSFAAQSGSIVVAKIGKESVKIAVD